MKAGDQEHCGQVCAECGTDDILRKPVRLKELLEVVRRWVPHALPADLEATKMEITG
jgi:DNA-binding response OmpR family regulator